MGFVFSSECGRNRTTSFDGKRPGGNQGTDPFFSPIQKERTQESPATETDQRGLEYVTEISLSRECQGTGEYY